jgi:hypothetical protein
MPLNSSGQISIGGTTLGQSINIELGRAATASSNLNETNLRNLADKASGAISLSDFYSKAAVNITSRTVNRQGNGSVFFRLNSDGVAYTSLDGTTWTAVTGEWRIDGTPASSSYEARMGTLSGTGGTPSGTFNTWLGLGTTREWSLYGEFSYFDRSGFLEIRNAATGQVLDSATIQFIVDAF